MSINGGNKTEENYREIMLDSSSSLKDFSLDRKKYLRKYILNEEIKDKDTTAIVIGNVVETLLLEPEIFDSKFYMTSCANIPTGLMLAFVEALYTYTKEGTNEDGIVTRDFEDISRDAYEKSGFKIKYEAVINKFVGSDAEIYFDEILIIRTNHLTIVSIQDVTNANNIVAELKANYVTKDILNLVDSSRYSILVQLQVEAYKLDGHKFKSMMDLVIIDHKERTIQIYDLKVTWTVENFYSEYYLYRRAYIQAYLYWKAGISLTEDVDGQYYGYTVMYPQFIVCDSTNYYNPLIYTLTTEDINNAYQGFERNGRQYPGVKDIIIDLQWALENNLWNMSRKNYLTQGIVNIKE